MNSNFHNFLRSNSTVQQYQQQTPVNLLNSLFPNTQIMTQSQQWQYGSAFGGGNSIGIDSRASPTMLQNMSIKNLSIPSTNSARIGWNIPQTSPIMSAFQPAAPTIPITTTTVQQVIICKYKSLSHQLYNPQKLIL